MDNSRLLDCMTENYTRLRAVVPKDLSAAVPSCPGWTVTDLVRHVAEVYLDKVECMRQQKQPDPWPQAEIEAEEPLALLDRAWADLTQEFAERTPDMMAFTWYDPDQTVAFWIRRMAQETVVHCIDAELALGAGVAPVPDDLAVDGVDEFLMIFLGNGSQHWREFFEEDLRNADTRPALVTTGGFAWQVSVTPAGVLVSPGGATDVAMTISGPPEAVLRWLWGRGGDGVSIDGDEALATQLRRLLVLASQ
jgi:uncharacterized protein (TIGR03083 family)